MTERCTDTVLVPVEHRADMLGDPHWELVGESETFLYYDCLDEVNEPCQWCGVPTCGNHDFHNYGECRDVLCAYGSDPLTGIAGTCWHPLTVDEDDAGEIYCKEHRYG